MDISRARRIVPFLLGSIAACPAALADLAGAFPSPGDAAQVNERTVGVVFERDERFFDLVDDIESSLSLAAGLRVVPIVGRNHVQNVYDLLYLDGVDLALVRSDSIEYVRRVAGLSGARRLARNVARIGNEKIVVIAHEAYATLDELADRPVAFGRPGSGEFVTGTLLFDSIGVDVTAVEAAGEAALERVRSGELAAMVHLLDAPAAFAAGTDAPTDEDDGARVLALPRDERLSTLYRPATLDATDLPGWIGDGAPVSTYSVDVNLVAYAWGSRNDRTRRMDRFVEALVDRLEELQGDDFQPEWEAVELETDTPNIDSSPMVERALAAREAALERWHERRRLAREAEGDVQAVYVEQEMPGGKKTIRRLDDGTDRESGSTAGVERLFDELDALLATPADRAAASVDANRRDGDGRGPIAPIASDSVAGGPGS